jgi:hypothetical protein
MAIAKKSWVWVVEEFCPDGVWRMRIKRDPIPRVQAYATKKAAEVAMDMEELGPYLFRMRKYVSQ